MNDELKAEVAHLIELWDAYQQSLSSRLDPDATGAKYVAVKEKIESLRAAIAE